MSCGTNTNTNVLQDGTAEYPFILKQGRSFDIVAVARAREGGPTTDLLVPARTPRGQLRRQVADLGTPVATFEVTIRDPQTGSDRGRADVNLGADVSAATADPLIAVGDYVADVEFENDADAGDVLATDVFYIRVVGEVTK